ncbi:hypothetical protein [Paraferrimonas sp. SM1919]|uniref:hypothetical protein n=1 Tax=Paraferrimonas sp. SM1919 TaxID=2662263 RepID=UPI0013CFEC85|nr:hypothetical protein [Paraferrimonas sp. SM1919]
MKGVQLVTFFFLFITLWALYAILWSIGILDDRPFPQPATGGKCEYVQSIQLARLEQNEDGLSVNAFANSLSLKTPLDVDNLLDITQHQVGDYFWVSVDSITSGSCKPVNVTSINKIALTDIDNKSANDLSLQLLSLQSCFATNQQDMFSEEQQQCVSAQTLDVDFLEAKIISSLPVSSVMVCPKEKSFMSFGIYIFPKDQPQIKLACLKDKMNSYHALIVGQEDTEESQPPQFQVIKLLKP